VRLVLAFVLAALLVGWLARVPILRAIGAALVAEDTLASVEVIAVSHADVVANALEAAALMREGLGRRVVVAQARKHDLQGRLDELGVAIPSPEDLATEILVRSGVPREAIAVLPGAVDGTNTEIMLLVRFANRERPESLLYVTSRSHTARAGWRLRREAPGTRMLVRAPRTDDFHADDWWRRRGSTREVMTEYLRSLNSYVLGDHWRGGQPSGSGNAPRDDEAPERP
jgi:uncharacterized SAM-binding protein YcdF (DUF218 family)